MLAEGFVKCMQGSILFGALPEDVFNRIAQHAHVTTARQGDTICREGEEAFSVFCVAEGAVKLTVAGRNGREVVVDIFHPGTCFAEALLFRKDAYPVSAVALTDSKVILVSKSVIEAELLREPGTIPTLLSATYAHLHRLLRQIEHLKATSGLQRVAGYILALDDLDRNTNFVQIPYEKQTLASMLGIKPETLSRSFRRLSEHGVRVDGPIIEVMDRKALEAFLGEA
ncbi:Crp/Fnr family transcriptional regulator [Ovoidimarina sediminis]|uniref:Crp/Fnr family transcriptional regulator n=1 Tax=Ovoidimarina sediminis TaxID=3079856 RepID=UPI0029068274|nr:cyclic nucleotide-binding domain-containing protein [Rhodophyticola sp. MJ-SS7]MDU8941835.1 cyclic nucleotide-binding domain-containing protein [Rhodophyticola sp. MJ-SS7]